MKNETWKYVLLMQSYGCFLPIPRKISDSSSSCMDKLPFFGQMAEKGPKIVQSLVCITQKTWEACVMYQVLTHRSYKDLAKLIPQITIVFFYIIIL